MKASMLAGDFGGVMTGVNTEQQQHSSSDIAMPSEPAACTQCGTVSTPQWRAGPAGDLFDLCSNAEHDSAL
jgi:hypothetical protein